MRHEGENSGLSTCKLSKKTKAEIEAAIARQAANWLIFAVRASSTGRRMKFDSFAVMSPETSAPTDHFGHPRRAAVHQLPECQRVKSPGGQPARTGSAAELGWAHARRRPGTTPARRPARPPSPAGARAPHEGG